MRMDDFSRQIEAARWRITALEHQGSSVELINQIFEELHTTSEELWVAHEELRQQHEELIVAQEGEKAERRRYQELFAFAPDAYLVTDLQGIIREANNAASALFQTPNGYLIGYPLVRFVADADARHGFFVAMQQIQQDQAIHEWDITLQPRKAAAIDVALRVTAERDHAGVATGLRWLLRDVSTRKQMEAAIHQNNHELEQRVSERTALLDTLLDAAPVGMAFWNQELRYVRCNTALATMEGVAAADHQGRTVNEVVPDLAPKVEPLLRHVLATGEPLLEHEFQGTTSAAPDQEQHWLASYYPVRTPDGVTLGVGGVICQITGRKQAEAERAELLLREQLAREQAELMVQEREAFLAVAAHELKTPLTSVLGYAMMLRERVARTGTITERDLRALENIATQASRLNTQLDTLLDIGRLDSGQFSVTCAPLDLVPLVQRVLAMVQPTLCNHTLEHHLPPSPVVISADADRIEQGLHNLLSNALKYSPAGGPIVVTLTTDEDHARLSVSDQGLGIAKAIQPQLFQRFYRASRPEGQGIRGLGIGLYVVKEVIQAHGGSVDLASSEGEGSTFTINLPLAHPDQQLRDRYAGEPA